MSKTELSEKAKEARRAYRREWAKKNQEKVKAAQARYWNKKAEELYFDEDGQLRKREEAQEPAEA